MARPTRHLSSTPARDLPIASAAHPSLDSPSGASDKENQPTQRRDKGKGRMAPPTSAPMPNHASTSTPSSLSNAAKRRRVDVPTSSRRQSIPEDDDEEDRDGRKYYNPDQNPEERQALKRKSRALEREFNDNRDVYLRTDNNGLEHTITKANTIFEGVKQTSDATLDSRLMVNVSDLLSKKSAQMLLGDSSTGLDLDEFVSKCIQFMREDSANPSATQRRRRPSRQDDDDDDQDATEYLDWAALGSRACFPSNARPPVSAFLLGPLSVQKKARAQTQRRARQARDAGAQEVRPETLSRNDLGRTESNTLTVICSKIRETLQRHCEKAEIAVNQAGQLSEDLMKRLRVGDTGGPHLFDFVVNPHSFGQTVENIFYVSFLIKEGNIGIDMDSDGLPTLSKSLLSCSGRAQTDDMGYSTRR